jgi:PAS domain S-box-containing protein
MPSPVSSPRPDVTAARLSGLLDSAMDAILSVDESQTIVLYNRAAERMFGWTAAEALGRKLELLIPQRLRPGHASHVQRFGTTGVTSRRMGDGTVLLGLRKGGEEFPLEASISQLQTPEGRVFTAILRDVTERVRARQELAAFAAEASGVREQEKSRIARELHDELAQSLTALKMDTIWVRDNFGADPQGTSAKLAQMLAMLDEAVASTRRIAADLRPLVLDDLGLGAAIEWLAQSFGQRTGVKVDLEVDEDLDLPEPWATGVFRIVQESLANVAKHAQAQSVRVQVLHEAGELVLCVHDDGVGFRPADPRKPQSLGLVGLRERAHLLHGRVQVSSAPGQGTRVEARIPVQEAA